MEKDNTEFEQKSVTRSELAVGQQGVQEFDSRKGEVEIKAEWTLYVCPVLQQPNSYWNHFCAEADYISWFLNDFKKLCLLLQ